MAFAADHTDDKKVTDEKEEKIVGKHESSYSQNQLIKQRWTNPIFRF
jgi:hypothetical protein